MDSDLVNKYMWCAFVLKKVIALVVSSIFLYIHSCSFLTPNLQFELLFEIVISYFFKFDVLNVYFSVIRNLPIQLHLHEMAETGIF